MKTIDVVTAHVAVEGFGAPSRDAIVLTQEVVDALVEAGFTLRKGNAQYQYSGPDSLVFDLCGNT